MAMDFTREDVEEAALVLLAESDGSFRWSSDKTAEEVGLYLERVSAEILRVSRG